MSNWVDAFGGLGGELTVTDDDDVVDITNDVHQPSNTDGDWLKHRRV